MKIVIVTDAWRPQVNGVVRTYENTCMQLQAFGHEVVVIAPDQFTTVPCPTYPSIHLAVFPGRKVASELEKLGPDAIHIATEGPLGHAARTWCLRQGVPFTTAFHTQFPEYIRLRVPFPLDWSYAWLKRFHSAAQCTMVPTLSQKLRLVERGFRNIVIWDRGVDTSIFKPGNEVPLDLPRPVFVNAGRVAVEKNITAFLDLDLPGSKLVIGDGPDLEELRRRYPEVMFTGFKFGAELAACLAAGDVFVFPSLTDTYGIVMLEAMACGLPVAAYPVTGPVDVVVNGTTGILDADLGCAARAALDLDPDACLDYARSRSWARCSALFTANLAPVTAGAALQVR